MNVINVNIGVLGHVDSGKTSLCKALSTVASTAAFDKNPQSKERGITLDLGFSSFKIDKVPVHLLDDRTSNISLQYTLVDCPGHASLIRTIIGGAQIIDLMILVIDIIKGIQTQTAECIVIGEISCSNLMVVLNKIDMVPLEKRAATIERMSKRISKTFETTKFKNVPIVAVSAHPGGSENSTVNSETPIGMTELINTLLACTPKPQRSSEGPFIFAVDHCFGIKGQGTVMTGTILRGCIAVGDTIEIPALQERRKVKSMQIFRESVNKAIQGARLGMCVTQFDPSLLERGYVCSPGALSPMYGCVVLAHKIPYYKRNITVRSRYHIMLGGGHEMIMGKISAIFSAEDDVAGDDVTFVTSRDYAYKTELTGTTSPSAASNENSDPSISDSQNIRCHQQFVLLEFDHAVNAPKDALIIAAKLDTDVNATSCRLAFQGRVLLPFDDADYVAKSLPMIKIHKKKSRQGVVERINENGDTAIVRNMFKKETNMDLFTGLKVLFSTGQRGIIEGAFGQSGKCKIRVLDEFPPDVLQQYQVTTSGRKKANTKKNEEETMTTTSSECTNQQPNTQLLAVIHFRRYLFDSKKCMVQS